jgi:hypothetical protein
MKNNITIALPSLVAFNGERLSTLLGDFRAAVKRRRDTSLADRLEEELLNRSPLIHLDTLRRLAKWCRTAGIYRSGMEIAREISLLIFGFILDRTQLGV